MGTLKNLLAEAVLTSSHNLCFEQKYENYQNFSSESFHFLVVIFLIYLNGRVFEMGLKNVFESATVNEPSVFESLKFYYTGFICS